MRKVKTVLKQARYLSKAIKILSGHQHLVNYLNNYANDIKLANESARSFLDIKLRRYIYLSEADLHHPYYLIAQLLLIIL